MNPPSRGEADSTMLSSPPASLTSDNEASKPTDDESQSQTQLNPKDQLREVIRSLKTPADRKCFEYLASDGILRVIQWLPTPPDQISRFAIYDAVPLSPEMMKILLDQEPWSQEKEDRFRGVDGRKVPRE